MFIHRPPVVKRRSPEASFPNEETVQPSTPPRRRTDAALEPKAPLEILISRALDQELEWSFAYGEAALCRGDVTIKRGFEPYEDRSESLHDLERSSRRLKKSSQRLKKSSECLKKSSQCLDETAACLAVFREHRSEFVAVLEQSFHVRFERESCLSEAKEDLSESFGTTKVSFDGRRSFLTAMGRWLGGLSGA